MIRLRPYQEKIIHDCRAHFNQGIKSVLITSPTGSGKTLLTAQMLKTASAKGHNCYFIVHRRELVKQSSDAFRSLNIPHGIISSGFNRSSGPHVQIASIQTLSRRLNTIKNPHFIVWDECHHLGAKSWEKIYSMFPNAWHIGLTATPCRLDGKGLGKYFERMVHGPEVRWLIDNGYLSDYKIYAPATVNLNGVHTRMGDYAQDDLTHIMDKPSITGDAISHYKRLANNKRAVVFAVSIEHSKHIVEQFNKEGINAAHIDGETPVEDRDATIQRFKNGDIKVLSNVELFGEGFDLPALEVAILLRPTQSLALNLQQIGRSLRPCLGKNFATILDHAGNTLKFGLPDTERGWSLEGLDQKKGSAQEVKIRLCKKCFCVVKSYVKICPGCGYVFETEGREVEQREGELVEISANAVMVKHDLINELWRAKTWEQLVELGRKRNYKNPTGWAWFILQGRKRKNENKNLHKVQN